MLIAKTKSTGAVVFGLAFFVFAAVLVTPLAGQDKPKQRPLNLDPPHISTDKSVKYDYDIVCVRLPRKGFRTGSGKFENPIWAQAGVPLQMNAGADLMLLHPDGREELAGANGPLT